MKNLIFIKNKTSNIEEVTKKLSEKGVRTWEEGMYPNALWVPLTLKLTKSSFS